MNVPLRQPRNYDADAVSVNSATPVGTETKTRQEFKEEADINVMLKRFGVTGKMPAPLAPPEYGDFDGIGDFEAAMHALVHARERFDQLPAEIREEFENDPHQFLEFVQDDENYDEAEEMGLVPTRQVPQQGVQDAPGAPPTPSEGVEPAPPSGEA